MESPKDPPDLARTPAVEGDTDGAREEREAPSSRIGVEVDSLRPPPGEGLLWRLRGVVRMMRPHQWVKNVFVLAPVVFAREIFDPLLLTRAASAFLVFCLLAAAVYTINDLADVESDRSHPIKRFRPIAWGQVPPSMARVVAVVLVIVGLTGAALTSLPLLAVAAAYFALNVAYSLRLKHVAYVDVACISAGFVLRVMAGGFGTRIVVSNYLLVCTALLALFLGFGKRRQELAVAMGKASLQRAALESYSKRGLDTALATMGVATVVTYLAYTLDPHTVAFFRSDYLWVSTVFVVLGVARFLFLVSHRPRAESPTQEMLKDGPFVAIMLSWVILIIWLVYNLRPGR
ncbi:MAG: decaprenyl-phosphate phosphoribosyltransferase [Polyangiaceae bacterium]|nr:decaprenyl-phosphate phosphoribosyltransferase [Polyangiaceae bacterium]